MIHTQESHDKLTFDQLPKAVATMLSKMDLFENRLLQLHYSSPTEDKPLSANEAAEFLGIPKNTLYALTSKREIIYYKPAKHLIFFRQDLIDWVKKGRQSTVTEIQAEARKGVKHGK